MAALRFLLHVLYFFSNLKALKDFPLYTILTRYLAKEEGMYKAVMTHKLAPDKANQYYTQVSYGK